MILEIANWLGWAALMLAALVLLDGILGRRKQRERTRSLDKLMAGRMKYDNPHQYGTRAWYGYEDWWEREGAAAARAHNERLKRKFSDEEREARERANDL